ncbi:MAG: hypothetical protein JOY84_08420 [Curvibacter sp.]|nr:hypothetical protein [Curvibacter sp.]
MPFSIPGILPMLTMSFTALEWLACLLLSYLLGILSLLVLPAVHAFSQRFGHDDRF